MFNQLKELKKIIKESTFETMGSTNENTFALFDKNTKQLILNFFNDIKTDVELEQIAKQAFDYAEINNSMIFMDEKRDKFFNAFEEMFFMNELETYEKLVDYLNKHMKIENYLEGNQAAMEFIKEILNKNAEDFWQDFIVDKY